MKTVYYFVVYVFLFLLCVSCTSRRNSLIQINRLDYIPEVHTNHLILKADSFAIKGDIDSAATFYSSVLDTSVSLLNQYVILKLAEINYFDRFILDSVHFKGNLNAIFSKIDAKVEMKKPLYSLISFYLNKSIVNISANQVNDSINVSPAFIQFLHQTILFTKGEYYKSESLQLDSSLKYFNEYFVNVNYEKPFLEYYWAQLRLSQLYIYKRDHLTSVSLVNQLLKYVRLGKLESYRDNLLIHKADLLYRFDYFSEAENIVYKVVDSINKPKYNKLYQKAIKELLIIYMNNGNISEFNKYRKILWENIAGYGEDFINYNKIVGRYFFQNGQHDSAIAYQEKALQYSLAREAQDIASLSTLCYIYSESLEKLGFTQKAIKVFLMSTDNGLKNISSISEITSQKLLSGEYYYVILTRLASIYLSDYKYHKTENSLKNSSLLAGLADSLIQKYLIESNEDKQLSFIGENRFIVNLLKEISLIKFQISHDQVYLFNYLNYYERNKALTSFSFSNVSTTSDSKTRLKQLKLKSKHFLLKDIYTNTNESQWNPAEFDQFNKELDSLIKIQLGGFSLNKNEVENKLKRDSSIILVFDKIDTMQICIKWSAQELKYFKLPSNFVELSEKAFKNVENNNLLEPVKQETYVDLIPKDIFPSSNGKVNKILVSQDESFKNFNVEWLPLELKSAGNHHSRYVIEEFLVLYISSIYDYTHKQMQNSPVLSVNGCFWTDEKTLTNPLSLPELPGCIKEQQSTSRYFPNANLQSGFNFNKSGILSMLHNKSCDVFHLSTHVSSNDQIRDDIKIYVRSASNGIDSLYAFELINEFGKIKNAILIGCETGKGRDLPTQNSFTLANYFLQSGTDYVISTVQKISDKESALFCNYLYKNFINMSFEDAYRKTKLDLLEENHRKLVSDIFFDTRVLF